MWDWTDRKLAGVILPQTNGSQRKRLVVFRDFPWQRIRFSRVACVSILTTYLKPLLELPKRRPAGKANQPKTAREPTKTHLKRGKPTRSVWQGSLKDTFAQLKYCLFQKNKGKPPFTSCNVQVYNVRIPVLPGSLPPLPPFPSKIFPPVPP